MKFLDLFAGIGGFRLGMEQAGHECVGYVEWDKFARKSYEAIHNTEGEWTANDITTVTDDAIRGIGSIDAICGGFPCQAFSVAGKRKGFEDTRGTLFFEIMRFASILRPRYLFLENVTGLLNHENGSTFETILTTLDEVGYDAEWDVLNSKDYGVPQNRERIFIIGHLRGRSGRKVFPIGRTNEETGLVGMLDIKGKDQIRRVYGTDGISPTLTTMQGGGQEPKILDDQGRRNKQHTLRDTVPTLRAQSHGNEPKVVVVGNTNPSGNGMNGNVFSSEGLAPTLTTNKGEGNKIVVPVLTPDRAEKSVLIENNTVIQKTHGATTIKQNETGTLQAARLDKVPMVVKLQRIRKLTPRECWRLQGYPDWTFDKAAEVNSDSQLYKQAGNSVTVNVIHAIASRLEQSVT